MYTLPKRQRRSIRKRKSGQRRRNRHLLPQLQRRQRELYIWCQVMWSRLEVEVMSRVTELTFNRSTTTTTTAVSLSTKLITTVSNDVLELSTILTPYSLTPTRLRSRIRMGKFNPHGCLIWFKRADRSKLSHYDNSLEEDNLYFHNQDSNHGMFKKLMKTWR